MTVSVNVAYDDKGNVTVDPTNVTVSDGDQVWWKFSGLPDGWFGFIQFDSRFGPFHCLRSFSSASVLGKGNVGSAASYSYKAHVVDPKSGDVVSSGPATVANDTSQVDTSPDVTVLYNAGSNLTVQPQTVSLNIGDTATWLIQGLPEDAVAVFWFDPVAGYTDPVSGPFTDFMATLGSGATSVRACGLGFANNASTAPASITYHIRVIDASGKTLGQGDPVIDNIGPPIPPTA